MTKFSDEDRAEFSRIQEYSRIEDWENATLRLAKFVEKHPNYVRLRGSYALGLWEIGDLDEAISQLRICLEQEPNREQISLMLFHYYWLVGRTTDAITEMKRYMESNQSDDYDRIYHRLKKEAFL